MGRHRLIISILILILGLAACASDEPMVVVTPERDDTEMAAGLPAEPDPRQETIIDLQPSQKSGSQASLFSPGGDSVIVDGDDPVEIEFSREIAPEPSTAGPIVDIQTDIEAERFAIPGVSFELPLGWEMVTLGPDRYVLRPIGADTIFAGPANTSPFIYVRLAELSAAARPLESELERMRTSLGGVEIEELPVSPILDGVRSGGQFVEGRNDQLQYRAFLIVIPLTRSQVVELVFWGDMAAWTTLGQQMARVLETMRLPAG